LQLERYSYGIDRFYVIKPAGNLQALVDAEAV